MSSIHILAGGTANRYSVVVHAPAPVGNNTAGVSWADAIKNSGRAVSVMPVGPGAGQITQAELNNVQAGTVIEGQFLWDDDPSWTTAQRNADLDLRSQQLITELTARYTAELRYFGLTR